MKRYITKPIDYTGCHQVVAKHLKSNKAIMCMCWGGDGVRKKRLVCGYDRHDRYRSRTLNKFDDFDEFNDFEWFSHAVPIEIRTETRIKGPVSRMVKLLEDRGYIVDGCGHWSNGKDIPFSASMFQFCGKSPASFHDWLPDWLEEVEVEVSP